MGKPFHIAFTFSADQLFSIIRHSSLLSFPVFAGGVGFLLYLEPGIKLLDRAYST